MKRKRTQSSYDQARFFQDFDKPEFDWDLGDEFQKEARNAQLVDIMNKNVRLPVEWAENQPMGSWENGVIDAIDKHRGRSVENDIMPGVIQDGRFFRCSKRVDGQTISATFADRESAIDYMTRLNLAYQRYVR